ARLRGRGAGQRRRLDGADRQGRADGLGGVRAGRAAVIWRRALRPVYSDGTTRVRRGFCLLPGENGDRMSGRWRVNRGRLSARRDVSASLLMQRLRHAMGNHGGDAALTLGRNVMRFSLTRWLPAAVVGAVLLAATPASAQRVFVPPTINSTTVQSNWNYWQN